MYLTASRPDITFAVCACARFQVTPKVSHLHAVKRIFRYLKGQPKLGIWYLRDSPFDLEAFSDSDYAGAILDRKSTTEEYVAAANCCGQVLWIQNQMLDYGFNFMNTKIYIDNESTICIVKNLKFHAKTKHIEIRHHFIRDSYEKRLIQVINVHSDHNVADLLTRHLMLAASIRDEFRSKTGSCKAKNIEYLKRVKSQTPRQAKRGRDTKIPQSGGPPEKVGDEAVHKELGDRMERAATTASSLEAEQDNGLGSGPRVDTLGSGEDSMKLKELMELCTKLSNMKEIEVNAGNSKLMLLALSFYCWNTLLLLSIKFLLLAYFTAARLKLMLLRIQALVDEKKVIITKTSIRRALHLKDAEGTDCLPNATIFAELERMGYENLTQKLTFYKAFFSPQWKFLIHTILQCLSAKTTAWNEFSSFIASAIICGVKFLLYPRFVQVFMNKQVERVSKHKETYDIPSHSKKVFVNMKRQENKFSGRITPLFPTMLVQAQEEVGEGSANPVDPYHTPTNSQPSTSQPQQKQKSRKSKKKNTELPHLSDSTDYVADENVTPHSNDLLLSGEDSLKLNELMDLCTKLSDRVLALESIKTTQALDIASLKRRVKKLKKKAIKRTHKLKRLYREDAYKHERSIEDMDKDTDVTLVDATQENDNLMFDTCVFDSEEVVSTAEKEVSTADPVTTAGEVVTITTHSITTAGITIPVSIASTTFTTTATTTITPEEITLA
ncbi:hypothetical protein Tco_0518029 [Tanacetum coccineum]